MSSALNAVVAQIEEDRRRFKKLVNGDETTTVTLDGRTEKSIANTVKTRLDSLTLDLSTAVSDAEQSASSASLSSINAGQSATDANTALSGTTTARNEAEGFSVSAQQASTDAENFKIETEGYRTETLGYRDQVVSDKNAVSSLASQVTTDANIVASDKTTTSSLKDDVILLKQEIKQEKMVTPMTISSSIDPTEVRVHRINRENNPTITISSNPPAGRFAETFVFLEGTTGSVTWPVGINWDGDEPVSDIDLGENWTVVSLKFFADTVVGQLVAKG